MAWKLQISQKIFNHSITALEKFHINPALYGGWIFLNRCFGLSNAKMARLKRGRLQATAWEKRGSHGGPIFDLPKLFTCFFNHTFVLRNDKN